MERAWASYARHMLRLAEQGLTKSEAQQGFRVTPLSVADLNELTDARVALESLKLENAIKDGDVDWESRVVAAHHRLSRTPQVDSRDTNRFSEDWAAAHAEFHETLLAGCSNTHLKGITSSLRDSAELYRRWSISIGLDVDRHISDEHSALLDAALKRDTKKAVDLLAEHIRRTTRVLLSSDAVVEGSEGEAEPSEKAPGGKSHR